VAAWFECLLQFAGNQGSRALMHAAAFQNHAVPRGVDRILGATSPLWDCTGPRDSTATEEEVLCRAGDIAAKAEAQVRSFR
jgi:hypothetical protein